jgi:hypothetical protein
MADHTMEVRPFDAARDLDEVLRLFEIVFGWAPSRTTWEWKYGPPWSDRTYAWVSRIDGRLVGHAGVIPHRGLVNGQEVPFAQFADIMLHPDFQGRSNYLSGPSVALGAIRRESPHTVLFGYVGSRAAPWYQRLVGKSALATECEEFVVTRANAVMDGMNKKNVRVMELDWEAPEIDRVWKNAERVFKTGLIRDRTYLRWRYAGHPTHRYHLFGVHEGAEVIGWLITAQIGKSEEELRPEVRVVDLLVPKERVLEALQEAAVTVHGKAVVAWLPRNLRPSSAPTRETGSIALHHFGTSRAAAESVQDDVYYTLGEADEWWW